MAPGPTFCRLCIASCGLLVELDGDAVVAVRGDPQHPVSRGYSCAKGRALGALEHHPRRILAPRLAAHPPHTVGPDEAVEDLAAELGSVRDLHGAEAIAVYHGTGAGFDAATWAACSWFTRAVGTSQRYTSLTLDAVAKPYVAELVTGSPALVPQPDPDARLVIVIGSNPIVSHGHTVALSDPVARMRRWRSRGPVWVVDPRRTETTRHATRHLACRPGSDHILLAHLVRQVLASGRATTDGMRNTAQLATVVEPVDRETVARRCDVDPALVDELVDDVLRAGPIGVLTGTGSTMAPAANLTEWLTLALLAVTGSLESPGGCWFHPGYFSPTRRPGGDRRPATTTGTRWGQRPAAELLGRIEAGAVRALVVVGGNPLTAFPSAARTRAVLARLHVLAVVDVVDGPLTELATHVLPAFTQLERPDVNLPTELAQPAVIGQYTRALRTPPAGARAGWWWLAALGERLGCRVLPEGLDTRSSTEDVLRRVAGPRVGGVEAAPRGVVVSAPLQTPWLLDELPDGAWDLAPPELVEEWHRHEAGMSASPHLLLTPMREHGHVNSTHLVRTEHPVVSISTADAAAHGIADGALVELAGETSTLQATVRVDDRIRPGVVAVPHGHIELPVNDLTSPGSANPATGMPAYAAVPVRVRSRAAGTVAGDG